MRTAQTDSRTKERLLDAAEELMLAKGYNATSVEEICAAARLTKGSCFHYFESKEHLGRVVAKRYFATWQQLSLAAPFRRKQDPLDRAHGSIDFFIYMSRSPSWKGCLLGTFVQELARTHPGIRSACAAYFDELVQSFQKDLEEAKAKYAPRARWNPASVAEHLLAVAQGATILAKAKQDQKAFEAGLGHFKEYLKRLFER
jgi:TetR/AcrR family transcriptional repressor of nem operon